MIAETLSLSAVTRVTLHLLHCDSSTWYIADTFSKKFYLFVCILSENLSTKNSVANWIITLPKFKFQFCVADLLCANRNRTFIRQFKLLIVSWIGRMYDDFCLHFNWSKCKFEFEENTRYILVFIAVNQFSNQFIHLKYVRQLKFTGSTSTDCSSV